MKNLFCSYEQSLALKELGFDEPCFGFFDTFTNEVKGGNFPCEGSNKAPLKSQVFKWFRDRYNLFGIVYSDLSWNITGGIANTYGDTYDWDSEKFKTYEEAESACIDKLIEIIKEK